MSYRVHLLILLLLFSLVSIGSLVFGAVPIPLDRLLAFLGGEGSAMERTILLALRLPRSIEAGAVGMGLAVAGAFLQSLLRNPMADPYILGVSSGAAFGATVAIILGFNKYGQILLAFLSATLTIYTVYLIAKAGRSRIGMTTMLLAGIAISTFMSSLISLLMFLNHNDISKIIYWTMGGFSFISWEDVFFSVPLILAGSGLMYFYSRDINAIMTGEEGAEHLGIETEKVKKVILAAASLVTAAAVAVSGIIGFMGLIIPHISRFLVGPNMKRLVPYSALLGATVLILADTLARVILRPVEIPVGIITAACGGPFFLYLLLKNKNKA